MDPTTIGLLSFGVMMFLIILGVPIAFSMLATAAGGLYIIQGLSYATNQISSTFWDQATNFVFIAVPMYFLMGQLVYRTNIAGDLYDCVYKWLGRLPGGLAITSVVACAGFGAVSGGSVTAVATMGPMCMPAMRRYNYDDSLATGSIASAGTLGILIPPSIILVVYGIWTESSIGALFIAGIIPGIMMTIGYSATIWIRCKINPALGPIGESFNLSEKVSSLTKLLPVLLTFLVVIGGIYAGVFTPTEAAAVGVFALLVISLAMRRLNWESLGKSLLETMHTSAMIFVIIIGGHMMGKFVVQTGLTQGLIDWMQSLGLGPLTTMLMISILYIILGTVPGCLGHADPDDSVPVPDHSGDGFRSDLVRHLRRDHGGTGFDHATCGYQRLCDGKNGTRCASEQDIQRGRAILHRNAWAGGSDCPVPGNRYLAAQNGGDDHSLRGLA